MPSIGGGTAWKRENRPECAWRRNESENRIKNDGRRHCEAVEWDRYTVIIWLSRRFILSECVSMRTQSNASATWNSSRCIQYIYIINRSEYILITYFPTMDFMMLGSHTTHVDSTTLFNRPRTRNRAKFASFSFSILFFSSFASCLLRRRFGAARRWNSFVITFRACSELNRGPFTGSQHHVRAYSFYKFNAAIQRFFRLFGLRHSAYLTMANVTKMLPNTSLSLAVNVYAYFWNEFTRKFCERKTASAMRMFICSS